MRFFLPLLSLTAALVVATEPTIPDGFDVEHGAIEVVEGEPFNITSEEFGDTELPTLEEQGKLVARGMSGRLKLGKNYIEYGCDASIRKTLNGAILDLCDRNGCDRGRTWSRKVKWTRGTLPEDMKINVQVHGTYRDTHALKQLRLGIEESVRPETVKNKKIKWSWRQFGGWEVSGTCNMGSYPNYVSLTRFNGKTSQDSLHVYISIKKKTSLKVIAQSVLGIIGKAVTRRIGGWAGKVSASQ